VAGSATILTRRSNRCGKVAVSQHVGIGVEPSAGAPVPRVGRIVDWPQRVATLGVLTTLAAAAAFVLRFDPTDRVADPTGPCAWHALTGINGPTCGGTRMFYYLLHGDLVEAARHHLAALIAVPFVVYAFLQWTFRVWFGTTLPPLRLSRWVYIDFGAFWLLDSVALRNLAWAPFSWFDIPNLDH
jgi:Protein of unknown function (DUF2752)